jgi:uncharacterized membrane protein
VIWHIWSLNIGTSTGIKLDLTCACPILIFHGWSMFFAGSADEFGLYGVLIHVIRVYKPHEVYNSFCTHFAFKTSLCDPFEMMRQII